MAHGLEARVPFLDKVMLDVTMLTYLLLATRYFLLATRYSLLASRYSLLNT